MTLTVLGSVAVVAGALSLLGGAAVVVGGGTVSASVDSELRFYAAWYAAAGVVLLRAVPHVESETTTIRAVAAIFFVAACARLLSLVVVGPPHTLFLSLMGVEFALPVVLVPWQAAVARRTSV